MCSPRASPASSMRRAPLSASRTMLAGWAAGVGCTGRGDRPAVPAQSRLPVLAEGLELLPRPAEHREREAVAAGDLDPAVVGAEHEAGELHVDGDAEGGRVRGQLAALGDAGDLAGGRLGGREGVDELDGQRLDHRPGAERLVEAVVPQLLDRHRGRTTVASWSSRSRPVSATTPAMWSLSTWVTTASSTGSGAVRTPGNAAREGAQARQQDGVAGLARTAVDQDEPRSFGGAVEQQQAIALRGVQGLECEQHDDSLLQTDSSACRMSSRPAPWK
jgi:hypothetical protein